MSTMTPPSFGHWLAPSSLINSLTPRAVISVFHQFAVDGVIASFPKTGNTWFSALLRHLMIKAYNLPPAKMTKLFVSDHRPSQVFKVPFGIPLFYHSHFIVTNRGAQAHLGNMREILAPFRHTPMMILYRDPKDVLVSYYMEVVFREPDPCFVGSVDDFAHSDVYGVKKFVAYYNTLAEFRRGSGENERTMITRYENLWSDTVGTLRNCATFLGVRGFTEEHLRYAVEQCSMKNMRRMEGMATRETVVVPDLFRPERDRPEARRVRVGGSGNWQKHLSPDVAAWIDEYVRRHLDPFFIQDDSTPVHAKAGNG